MVTSTPPAALPPGKRPGTHCIGGWVGPGPVWTGAENLTRTGIRSPDRPARSEPLYRLSYRGHIYGNVHLLHFHFILQKRAKSSNTLA